MEHRSIPPALVLGDEGIGALAHRHMAMGALKGVPQVVVDCGGHFDPYAIAKEARGVGRSPANVLERVIVARAFTAYQEITLLLRLRREYTVDHRIFLLNPLDLFVDPDLPHGDGLWIFGRLHAALHHFHETGYRLFLYQRHQAETSLLFQKLCRDRPSTLPLGCDAAPD